ASEKDISSVRGDINADGRLDVADLVLLNKWLLARPDSELADWKAGDLCGDDRLDVFDLMLMRRELIER
ncbi:MAG: dockerin type I repeat-containing protein, partial [Ruminococcus sp.]|nr:dockerin type I repeat-containing protein [Ruminococcus sp.]